MIWLFINGFISSGLVQAICWTLLHSLWQGLISAAIAGLVILATRRSKATLRYNLLSAVFIIFMLGTMITFFYQTGITGPKPPANPKAAVTAARTSGKAVNPDESQWSLSIPRQTFFQPIIYYGNKYSSLITGIWAIFFLINFLKMLSGLRYAYRLRFFQTTEPDQEWKERLYTLGSLLGIHNRVILKESERIAVPVMVGFLKPVILVPLGMFANLSVEQVEAIFVHELAHVRRKDFAVNLVQRFAEAVYFFNPFVGWISSLIREEREACCDDIVLEYTTDKKTYLDALVSFRENGCTGPAYAMGLGSRSSLLNRVKRIITNENNKLNAMEKIALILVVLVATAFGFIPKEKLKPSQLRLDPPVVSVTKPLLELKLQRSKRFGKWPNTAVNRQDSIPSRSISFKNISSQNTEDGSNSTSDVKATGSDGKKYSYKLVNEEIKEIVIDDVPVSAAYFKDYQFIIEKIEDQRQQSIRKALQTKDSRRLASLLETQQLLKEKQWEAQIKVDSTDSKINLPSESNLFAMKLQQQELQNEIQQLLTKSADVANLVRVNNALELLKFQQKELLVKNSLNLNLLDKTTDAQQAYQQELLNTNAHNLILKQETLQKAYGNSGLEELINDLTEEGLVKDKNDLSFTLNNQELIVNGRGQPRELWEKLKSKYITSERGEYIYKTNGHSTSVNIVTK